MTDLPRSARLEQHIDQALDLAIDAEQAGDSQLAEQFLATTWRLGQLQQHAERLALSDIDWPEDAA